ncbi:MAG: hypothetical protein HQK76_19390 [Desulfobacterales bacterium]|nr:hypothetical protein [Desulfobacterales bacterium]
MRISAGMVNYKCRHLQLLDARKVINALQKELFQRKGIKGLLKAIWD